MFKQRGLESVVDNASTWLSKPRETVLVITGDVNKSARLAGRISRFHRQGGAVLIATDRGDDELLREFGIRFQRGPLTVSSGHAYKGLNDCPIVRNFAEDHPLFQDIRMLVTNRPGCLKIQSPRIADSSVCAWLPASAKFTDDEDASSAPLVLAMGQKNQRGRILLVADHSLLVNEMLLYGDNAAFAWNCVKWLCEGGERQYLLFVHDDLVLPTYEFGKTEIHPVPLNELIDVLNDPKADVPMVSPKLTDKSIRKFANHFVTSLEEKNLFNERLEKQQKRIRLHLLRRYAALSLAAIVGVVFLQLLIRRSPHRGLKHRRQNSSTNPAAHQRLVAGARVERFEHTVRILSREFFSQDLPANEATNWEQLGKPELLTNQSLFKRVFVQRNIDHFWKLATATKLRKIGRVKFDQLVKRLEKLQALRQAGHLRLQWL